MEQTLIGVTFALGASVLVLLALLVLFSRRSRQRAEEQVGRVVESLEARMGELETELAGAVERAEEEGRRSRFLGEIGDSIDLDEVLGRTLQAAGDLPGADAAVVRLESPDGPPILAAHGVPVEEAGRQQPLPGPPDGRRPRAVELAFRYGENGEEAVHAGVSVPLEERDGWEGTLTVYTRDPNHRFDEDDVRRLEELAGRASPAIENARRYRDARMLADLDAVTGLHNRRYFHDTLSRECARAHRYHRALALLVFELDGFKATAERLGRLAGDAVLADAAERIREVVRSADIAARIGGEQFAVIMPEGRAEEAEQLLGRIRAALAAEPIGEGGRLSVSAGVAEIQAEDDSITLFERADEKLYRSKTLKPALPAGLDSAA